MRERIKMATEDGYEMIYVDEMMVTKGTW